MKYKMKLSVGDLFLSHSKTPITRGILSETKTDKYIICWFHGGNVMHTGEYTKFEIESYVNKLCYWKHYPIGKQ